MRPHEHVLRRRIDHAKAMLVHTMDPLMEIALSVDFRTQAHFTIGFKRFVGEPPRQWRVSRRQLA